MREAGLKGANMRFATGRQNLQRAHKRPLLNEGVFFILNRDGKEKGFEAERTPLVADRQQEAAGSLDA